MDINLGKLSAYVRLDFSHLPADEKKAQKSIADFSKRLTREVGESMSALGRSMSLGLTAPLLGIGKAAVDSATKLDSLERGLTAVTGSTKETAAQLKRLESVAKLPGLGFEDAVQGSINLQAAGFSAKMAERSLKAFGNALATVGKGKEELSGVITALTQIQSKGKVSAEEINQLQERLPQIRQAMLAVFKTADTEVIQKAKISSKEFIEALVSYFEKAKQVSGGAKTSFENFQDSMRKSLAELGKAILPDLTKAMSEIESKVKSLTEWWKGLDDTTRQNYIRFGEIVAVMGPLTLAVGAMASAVAKLAGAMGLLKGTLAALSTPLGVFLSGIAATAAGIVYLQSRISALGKKNLKDIDEAGQSAMKRRMGILNNIPTEKLEERLRIQRDLIKQDEAALRAGAKNQLLRISPQQLREYAVGAGTHDYDLGQNYLSKPKGSAFEVRALEQTIRDRLAAEKSPESIAQAMDEEWKNLQDRIAKAARAGDDKKAASEAAKQARATERRQDLVSRVENTTEKLSNAFFDAQIKEWVDAYREKWAYLDKLVKEAFLMEAEQIEAEIKAELAAAEREMRPKMSDLFASSFDIGDILSGAAKDALKQEQGASAALGGAFDAFGAAMGMLSPMSQQAAEKTAQERIVLEEKIAAHSVRMGRMSLSAYEAYLQERLRAVQGNVEETMRLEAELQEVTFRRMEEAERRRFQGWQNLAQGMENVFANAFQGVLDGSKDFFQSLLDGFKAMLAQMLAQALAAGLMRALFGGPGGFLGGFMSVFGFDDAGNDSKARRWGRDFTRHFAGGAFEQARSAAIHNPTRMAGAGAGPVNVTVNFGPVSVSSGMDAQAIGEQIAMATRKALRRKV